MAGLREDLQKVLATALDKRRRDDSLEMAVGRETRRAGLTYQDYMEIVERVRECARKEKIEVWVAAKNVLDEK